MNDKNVLNNFSFGCENPNWRWQLARWERFALDSILNHVRPSVSVEVGTLDGGSTQLIAKYSEKVYSIDLSGRPKRLEESCPDNMIFVRGDSKAELPRVLEEIEVTSGVLQFVLLDGDHTESALRSDIESVLRIKPKSELYVLIHDSFHPECRAVIRSSDWAASPYVHLVEIDFVPGAFYEENVDTAQVDSMWGGFSLAVLGPEKRLEASLFLLESQKKLFDLAFANSRYLDRPMSI